MPGWIRRARTLLIDGCEWTPNTRAAEGAERDATVAGIEPSGRGSAARPRIASGPVVLRREGAYWTLASSEATHRLKDAKGLYYVAHLLRHAGQEFHVLDLVQGIAGRAQSLDDHGRGTRGAGLEILDAPAKAAYQQRLGELRDELDEAERVNDTGRAERAREEMEVITEQLATAVGLGGRDRVTGGAAERARSTVTKRIKDAINKIGASAPVLADHLRGRVRTGTFCVYLPDAARPIEWEL